MPLLFVVGFIAMALIFPQLMRFTVIGPLLAFTFGGSAWAFACSFGFAPWSLSSFALFFSIAYVVIIYLTRD